MQSTEANQPSPKRIFISYRRSSGIDTAKLIHDQLSDRGYSVFIDMEGLRAGAFNQALFQKIKNSDVFLIILSKNCLRRCRNPQDWVRQELAYAIRCGLNVIPIMKEDFHFPRSLPQEIASLPYYQAVRFSHDFFDAFMDKLEEYIHSEPSALPPDPTPPPFQIIAVIGCIAAALLAGAFFLRQARLAPVLPTDPSTEPVTVSQETTVPPTEAPIATTVPPETTVPPTEAPVVPTEPIPAGNTTTNLCNGGFVWSDSNAAVFLTSPAVRWYNFFPETETSFFYDSVTQRIRASYKNGEQSEFEDLAENVDCRYLYVSPEWICCVLVRDGKAVLYQAKLDLTNVAAKPDFQPIAYNLRAQGQTAIWKDSIFFWRQQEGLFRRRLDGSGEKLLLDCTNAPEYQEAVMFHVSDQSVYFFTPKGGIYCLPTDGGEPTCILSLQKENCQITHAVERDRMLCYTLECIAEGVRTAPAEIWLANSDGSNNRLLFALENEDMEILVTNTSGSTLYMLISEGGQISLYRHFIHSSAPKLHKEYS